MQQWTEAEKTIQLSVDQIEKMGCHLKLTEAVTLLAQARQLVAEFDEETKPSF